MIDWDVLDQLQRLPARVRRSLHERLIRLKDFPESMREFEDGRLLSVFICQGFAVLYWIDFADRHVKVLALTRAD